jgi:hypothetical protein
MTRFLGAFVPVLMPLSRWQNLKRPAGGHAAVPIGIEGVIGLVTR